MSEEYVGELVYDGNVPVPSLDMSQPIVRCRCCEFYNDHHFKCHRPVTLIAEDGSVTRTDEDDTYLAMTDAAPDGFCAWGERRDV